MENKNHVITRKTNRAECGAVCQNDRLSAGHIWQTRSHVYGEVKCQAEIQSDVVIPNELGNGETCQGLRHWRLLSNLKNNFSKPVRNDMVEFGGVTRHPEGDSPKDLQTQNHVITRKNIEQEMQKSTQSDVVIHNKLGNGETCQGLRHWRLLSNLKNNFLKPVRNDMDNKTVTNLFPYFPISLSLKKKFAFTLAETLITLGIIGIVAAMTIPTLVTNYQKKQTVTKLQKAISVLNQAYKLSYDDVGEPSIEESYDMGATTYFEKYWAPYIKTALICTTPRQCGYKTIFPWKYTDDSPWTMSLVAETMRTTFYTPDGFLYVILTASGPTGNVVQSGLVMVDINGAEGPNRLGRDLFLLQRVQENGGGIQPYGINLGTSAINNNCSSRKRAGGHYCAERIRRAGWEIDKSYPW